MPIKIVPMSHKALATIAYPLLKEALTNGVVSVVSTASDVKVVNTTKDDAVSLGYTPKGLQIAADSGDKEEWEGINTLILANVSLTPAEGASPAKVGAMAKLKASASPPDKSEFEENPPKIKAKFKPEPETAFEQESYQKPEFGVYDLKKAHHVRVKLKDATKLYQPVHATSDDSWYWVVGISPSYKVAVRIKPSYEVSIRVEGKLKGASSLDKLGLSVKGEYASMHVNAGNQIDAYRVVGSVLMGMDANWQTPWPDLELISKMKGG